MSIVGKVALVTGAASGIGLSLSTELLKNEAKAVALIDVNENLGEQVLKDIWNEFGQNRAIFIKADVSKEKEFEDAFAKTVETFQQLDLVFNNAGICDERDFQKLLKINLGGTLSGTFLALTKYLPKYKKGNEGIIVNISSISGLKPLMYIPVYSASKSGVISLGRSFGHKAYYDKYQVKVLTVCPEGVKTPLTSRFSTNLEETILLPEVTAQYIEIIEGAPELESSDSIAQKILQVMKKGESGSVWELKNFQSPKEIMF